MKAFKLLLFLFELLSIPGDLISAQAMGDRFAFIGTIRRLRGLFPDIDPAKISDAVLKLVDWLGQNPAVVSFLRKLVGMTVGSTTQSAHALTFNTLSAEDFAAAGILDNPGAWMTLVQALMALARMIWGADVLPFSTAEQPRLPLAPAPAAPIDGNATA